MCGIVGVLCKSANGSKFCMQGIELLQNRGYDSAGIVTVSENNSVTLTKYVSDLQQQTDCIA